MTAPTPASKVVSRHMSKQWLHHPLRQIPATSRPWGKMNISQQTRHTSNSQLSFGAVFIISCRILINVL